MAQQESLEFLSPYSPDFNSIEEYFGVLKNHQEKVARKRRLYSERVQNVLEWCVDVVGDDEDIAENHFHPRWTLDTDSSKIDRWHRIVLAPFVEIHLV